MRGLRTGDRLADLRQEINDLRHQMADARADDDVKSLIAAVNDTARLARNAMALMLVVGLYIAIILLTTTDVDLLKGLKITLPHLEISVPLSIGYIGAPALFLYFHAQLLHNLFVIRRQIKFIGNDAHERKNLFSGFIYVQHLLGYDYFGLFSILSIALFSLPPMLLLILDFSFIRYQSSLITFGHHICLTVDLAMLTIFAWRGDSPRSKLAIQVIASSTIAIFVWTYAWAPSSTLSTKEVHQGNMRPSWVTSNPLDVGPCIWWRFPCRYLIADRQRLVRDEAPPELVARFSGDLRIERENINLTEALFVNDTSKTMAEIRRNVAIAREALEEPLNLSNRNLNFLKAPEAKFLAANFSGSKLQHASLENTELPNAKFEYADLSRAALHFAKLSGTNFDNATLIKAEFTEAMLDNSTLISANLKNADLAQANLAQANLTGANLERADLTDVNLTDATMIGTVLDHADLRLANLKRAKLYNSSLVGTNLNGAILDHANLYKAQIGGANLFQAKFTSANLSEAILESAKIEKAILEDANLTKANLTGANLIGTNFSNAILRAAILIDAKLCGANFTGTDFTGVTGLIREQFEPCEIFEGGPKVAASLAGARGLYVPLIEVPY